MPKIDTITVEINIDMQKFYDDLVIYEKSIKAQIESLAKEPSICTHKETKEMGETGVTICANPKCGRVIDSGKYDYCT